MYTQLVMLVVSFAIMSLMLKKRVNFGIAMTTTAILLALLSGLGIGGLWEILLTTATSQKTLDTCGAVFTIGILGGLLGRYGILDKVVDNLGDLISSRKVIAMIIPALMGMMPVPGGAIMSVPFIDTLGEDIELSQPRKSAVNLVFRHMSMMVMPYSTALLMVASIMPNVGIYDLIPYNFIFMLLIFIAGYFCFIKDVPVIQEHKAQPSFKKFMNFMLYMSPVYVCIILNFALGVPIYLGAILSFVIVYFLSDKQDFFGKLKASMNFGLIGTIFGVMLLQNVIGRLDDLLALFASMVGTGISGMIMLALGGWFFAFITGMSMTPYGILLPLIVALPLSDSATLAFVYAVFIASYVGYYFSPLHLCQVFTNEYLKVETGELYREYKQYFILTVIAGIVCVAGVSLLLL